jgi:hypothetical protein
LHNNKEVPERALREYFTDWKFALTGRESQFLLPAAGDFSCIDVDFIVLLFENELDAKAD